MMNKKVLVLTLVLLLAFAGSAMADVSLTGEFEAVAEQNSLKVFSAPYNLSSKLTLEVKAAHGEDAVDWELSAGLKWDSDAPGAGLTLGKYKLGLYDNYFSAWAWGNDAELSKKATYFDFISAAKKAVNMRARLEVPVMDLATVTVDLDSGGVPFGGTTVKAFADGAIDDYKLGLAYYRNWAGPNVDVIVAQAGAELGVGGVDVDLKLAGGVTLPPPAGTLGYAAGFSVDSDVTEELNLNASVKHSNPQWYGEGVNADHTVISGGATYSEAAFQVAAKVTETLDRIAKVNTNEIELGARYRLSTALDYDDLFDEDEWFKNDGLAVGADLKLTDFTKAYEVSLDATYPVLADMIWVKGRVSYDNTKLFKAGVLGYILATNKLTVKPQVDFSYLTKYTVDLTLVADYLIGAGDSKLVFTAQKGFGDTPIATLLQLKVKVPF